MIHGHGGNIFALANTLGCAIEDIVDMSSNINPLGAMPGLLAHLQNCLPHAWDKTGFLSDSRYR